MSDAHGGFPPPRSFGRTRSRTIKPRQAQLMAELLPRLSLPDPRLGPVYPPVSETTSEVWLEIGFGGAEHMIAQAAAHPHILMLGAEPFQNGVASALTQIYDQALENVRIHMGDARDLIEALPDASLSRIFILFPDPWPKARHHKRRLINSAAIARLSRILKSGGALRFATDWADYGERTLASFLSSPSFDWSAFSADDWRLPPKDHATTRYETKGLGDIKPVFLDFRRR